jgi:hypothetical protein
VTATTARDMIEMLRRNYIPEGKPAAGIFAPEIQAPDSARRADLIWQGVTAAGRELVGHEIKVSRADLLAELADLSKTDPWQRYCDRWWLVVSDPNLITGLELPATWGVLAPPSGRRTRSMTVLAPAPALKPATQEPALRTLATWLHWQHHHALTDAKQARSWSDTLQRRIDELRAHLPASAERDVKEKRRDQEVVEAVIQGLGGASLQDGYVGDWTTQVSVEDVVTALKDLADTRRVRDQVTQETKASLNLLRSLRRNADAVLARFAPPSPSPERNTQ